ASANRYRHEGDAAFEPRFRRPAHSPTKLADELVELTAHGLASWDLGGSRQTSASGVLEAGNRTLIPVRGSFLRLVWPGSAGGPLARSRSRRRRCPQSGRGVRGGLC